MKPPPETSVDEVCFRLGLPYHQLSRESEYVHLTSGPPFGSFRVPMNAAPPGSAAISRCSHWRLTSSQEAMALMVWNLVVTSVLMPDTRP